MCEEGPLRTRGGASAFHHQGGAVRPPVRPTQHGLRHHVGSAGTVCWRNSESVFRCVCVRVVCLRGDKWKDERNKVSKINVELDSM